LTYRSFKLWYGSYTSALSTPSTATNRLGINRKIKKYGNLWWSHNALPFNNSIFPYLSTWSLLLLKHSETNSSYKLYFYNSVYYFTFLAPKTTVICKPNSHTNTIFFSQRFFNSSYNHYLTTLSSLFNSLSSVFFTKMKFKGKGYYIYKNFRNTIAPQFGYSHRIYIYAFNIRVKFLSKTSILLFGLSKRDILSVGYTFKSKKPINIFTGRGVRFSKQIIYRKTGKVSSYR
jgi:ribosomal protein L6P/L9E